MWCSTDSFTKIKKIVNYIRGNANFRCGVTMWWTCHANDAKTILVKHKKMCFCTEETPMQHNVTIKKTLHLCCKMWMSTSDSPDDTKFIFFRLHRGISRHNWSSIVMARMDTNNCFSEHSEHAPRWSDSQKHNDNNRTTLKNGFAENDVGPRPLLRPTAPRLHVFFSQFRYKYFKKF